MVWHLYLNLIFFLVPNLVPIFPLIETVQQICIYTVYTSCWTCDMLYWNFLDILHLESLKNILTFAQKILTIVILCSAYLWGGYKMTYLWTIKNLNDKVKLFNNRADIYWLTINWQSIIVSKIKHLMIGNIAKNSRVKHFSEKALIPQHIFKL